MPEIRLKSNIISPKFTKYYFQIFLVHMFFMISTLKSYSGFGTKITWLFYSEYGSKLLAFGECLDLSSARRDYDLDLIRVKCFSQYVLNVLKNVGLHSLGPTYFTPLAKNHWGTNSYTYPRCLGKKASIEQHGCIPNLENQTTLKSRTVDPPGVFGGVVLVK